MRPVPLTVALAAFLLFSIEPMVGKAALPWYGGSAEVWTACLAFFQIALFAGYAYARLLARQPFRAQVRIHGGLLIASLVVLPILPGAGWKPIGDENPLASILAMLGVSIGLPFVLLSSTSPLVQSWVAPTTTARSTYRLFALSNFASFAALLSYPFLIERLLPLSTQDVAWSVLYAGFVLLTVITMSRHRSAAGPAVTTPADDYDRPSADDWLLWFFLSAVPSGLLLVVTQHMLKDIAAIPLLWIAPLALYLLTLTLSFGWSRWYFRPLWYALFLLSLHMMTARIGGEYMFNDYRALLWMYAIAFFVVCAVCHAELAAARPAPRHLTTFYLATAAGGAAGGLLVAVVAPSVFDSAVYDLPLLAGAALALVGIAAWRRIPALARGWRMTATTVTVAGAAILTAFYLPNPDAVRGREYIFRNRTFYGEVSIAEGTSDETPDRTRELMNGNINHGWQFVAESRRHEPLSYFTRRSGIGATIQELGQSGRLRVGVIGLGAGTLAAYGRAGDEYRFYELDPLVARLAQDYFWYLPASAASWTIVTGDGRLALEREPSQQFDLLIVDAFSSDAIPMHLLTAEAFTEYWRHMAADGVLALHITNRYVDLAEIAAAGAAAMDKRAKLFSAPEDLPNGGFRSDWVLVTSRPDFFSSVAMRPAVEVQISPGTLPWTDDYSSLWRQLR